MSEYSSVRYKNCFLRQVIVRVDFSQFIQTNMVFDENIEKEILKTFPRRGKDQIIRFNSINLVLSAKNNGIPNANGEVLEGIQREYLTNDHMNRLILTNKFIVFEINQYSSFELHKKWVQSILLALFQRNSLSATRTGIRYINIFDTSKIKLQKNYFAQDIASSLCIRLIEEEQKPRLIRSMHTAEYRVDEMTMNFRYGMFNPEYPNYLKKNDFALDYDFFSDNVIDSVDEIFQVIDRGHYEIHSFSVKISIPLENTGVSSVFATSVWPFSLIFSLARRNEGNFFQAVPTTLSSSLAEVRLASLVAWA